MTIEEITKRIEQIKELGAHDDESAHAREDDLREDFLRYVKAAANSDAEIPEKAALVLSTNDLRFSRWCA